MKIKKVTAENTQIALKQIREILGEDAIVLHVEEKVDKKNKNRLVEVTAALDEEFQYEKKNRFFGNNTPDRVVKNNFLFDESAEELPDSEQINSKNSENQDFLALDIPPIFSELQEVKQQMNSLSLLLQDNGYPDMSPQFLENFIQLIGVGVNKKYALKIVRNVEEKISGPAKKSKGFVKREILKELEKFIAGLDCEGRSQKKSKRIRVLVGPTGVGKTTSIAKLSAIDKIYKKRKVGLISMDTYRIAAIEQLKTYANITKLPLEVVYSPSDMARALYNLSDYDVIYLDTPGRSPKNSEAIKDISRYLRECPDPEVHLVISMNGKEQDMRKIVDSFSILPVSRILFTKLDETDRAGALLGVLDRAKKPVSYLTTGQNVPDDIIKPGKSTIAGMLLGEKICR